MSQPDAAPGGAGPSRAAMDPGLRVRPMVEADVPAVRALMMRVVHEDFGEQHDPGIHADVDDLLGWYVAPRGPFMLVVEDEASGELVATGGIRDGALKPGLSPQHLVDRYATATTGQVVRVYVAREHRRRHIARALVGDVLARSVREGHYELVALHTYPHSPGALPFWRSMGCQLVADDTDGPSRAMFFEFHDDGDSAARTH